MARDRDSLQKILGQYSPVLDQNASNCTLAPLHTVSQALRRTQRVLSRLGGSDDGRWWAYQGLHAQIQ